MRPLKVKRIANDPYIRDQFNHPDRCRDACQNRWKVCLVNHDVDLSG
jgi:hypothetical protein